MVKWLTADTGEWTFRLKNLSHDIYHLPGYVEADAVLAKGAAVAYWAQSSNGEILIPLVRRSIPDQHSGVDDAISPYGYGGPIVSEGMAREDLIGFFEGFRRDGRDCGLVSSFLRLHPLLNSASDWVFDDSSISVINHGQTVSVDLGRPMVELDQDLSKNHKRDIRKLKKNGYTVRFNNWEDYAEFCSMYRVTMQRVGASDFYFFNDQYFRNLKSALGGQLVLCSVLSPEGEVAAGGIFGMVNGIAQYHLGATNSDHLSQAPSKLMFSEVRYWLQEAGAKVLHLGGGLGGGNDSLLRFKLGFGTDIHVFQTMCVIHDRKTFDRLNQIRGMAVKTGEAASVGYFPPYRRPLDT